MFQFTPMNFNSIIFALWMRAKIWPLLLLYCDLCRRRKWRRFLWWSGQKLETLRPKSDFSSRFCRRSASTSHRYRKVKFASFSNFGGQTSTPYNSANENGWTRLSAKQVQILLTSFTGTVSNSKVTNLQFLSWPNSSKNFRLFTFTDSQHESLSISLIKKEK